MLQFSFTICGIYPYFSRSLFFLHAVLYVICKVSLFHTLILQLLLLCTIKPANITLT